MEDYPVYSVCEQVQNARPEGAIQDCVEDIMVRLGRTVETFYSFTLYNSKVISIANLFCKYRIT